jgi:UrcA family protein
MISTRLMVSVIGTLALASGLLAPRATYADSVEQRPTVAVRYGDLNLDTRAGVDTLLRRIQVAAREVCKGYEPQGTFAPSAAHHSCMSTAISGAVRSVGSPALTAYYSERDDHRPAT